MPVHPEAPLATTLASPADGTGPPPVHVLAINHDPALLACYGDLLEEEGYRVSLWTVADWDLAAIAALAPDLIVLDAALDVLGADGHAAWLLLRLLRGAPRTAAIPVVLRTEATWAVAALPDRLADMGVRVVPTPFDIDTILAAVAGALAEQRAAARRASAWARGDPDTMEDRGTTVYERAARLAVAPEAAAVLTAHGLTPGPDGFAPADLEALAEARGWRAVVETKDRPTAHVRFRAMVWDPGGGGRYTFTRSVRGHGPTAGAALAGALASALERWEDGAA
jgi:CheY-like chemotaxis protein